MAAYRRVYDSRHLQADCQEPGSAPEPTLGSRVWATVSSTIVSIVTAVTTDHPNDRCVSGMGQTDRRTDSSVA